MIGIGLLRKQLQFGVQAKDIDYLELIDTRREGFYDNVINQESEDNYSVVNDFIQTAKDLKAMEIMPFYRPIMDPSFDGIYTNSIKFEKGCNPVVGKDYEWWITHVAQMAPIQGMRWHIGTECQYFAFLIELVNRLAASGKPIKDAIFDVVHNSRDLGHFDDSKNHNRSLEKTGSREVCGFYDLGNTYKLLVGTNLEYPNYWIATGSYNNMSFETPLADIICPGSFYSFIVKYMIGWLVLY